MRFLLVPLVLWVPSVSFADPHADLRAAASQLGRTSYTWETTDRQRLQGESAEAQLNPRAPAVVRGKIDPDTFSEITLLPSRDTLAVPVTAIFRFGDAVGLTPLGWRRRTEIRDTAGPDRMVDFAGKQVRLSRALATVLKAMNMKTPGDEVIELMAEAKAFKEANGLIIAELRDRVIEELWADPRAKNAPDIQGTVIFKLSDGAVSEYHILLAIGFPNSKTKKTAWQMMQWSTRIKGIGETTVEPPAEAIKKLDE
jgi:hypothetical protein